MQRTMLRVSGGSQLLFPQQCFRLHGTMAHVEAAAHVKPKCSRAVPIQFDSILIGIAEIQGFAHSMVNRSVDRDPGRF
jgi:hypothetical protein